VQVGAEKISLAVDTGHSVAPILLSPAILSHLDPCFTGRTQENYDAWGHKNVSKEFVLENVRIGSLVLNDVTGIEFLFPYETPGVIGLPFLRQFNVLFDYPDQTFGLYRKDLVPSYVCAPEWHKVKIVPSCPGIVIPVRFKAYPETFFFLLDSPSTYVDGEMHSYDLFRLKSSLGQLLLQKEPIPSGPVGDGGMGQILFSPIPNRLWHATVENGVCADRFGVSSMGCNDRAAFPSKLFRFY
jgi:hypothetical protein